MKKLGFGLMRLPLTDSSNQESIDQEMVNKMTDFFLENGFTYFDTAYPYHQGLSETTARTALVERHPRDSFTIADKMPVWLVKNQEDYQKIFDEQLERCGVEYFDYYMLHALSDKSYSDCLQNGGFDFIRKLKAEGKAKNIGFSYHDNAEVLDKILKEQPDLDFVQLQINYIDWDSSSIQSGKCYEVASKYNIPIIVMEPVKGGSLASIPKEAEKLLHDYNPDMTVASWAIRYTASLDNVITVLSGMSNYEQLENNISYMKDFKPLNKEEHEVLGNVINIINSSIAIPCTSCQYCVEDCPQNIPIPRYFTLYNEYKQYDMLSVQMNSYKYMSSRGSGKAGDCIGCKVCEEHCPQHIEIAEQMKEVSNVFDVQQ